MSLGYPRVRVLKLKSTHNRLSSRHQTGVTSERPPRVGFFFVLYLGPDEEYPEGQTIRTSRIQKVREVYHDAYEIETHNSTYLVEYLDKVN